MPKLSIIVPVYNVRKYIDKCIQSILNQSFNDLELILVDDGSEDESGVICDKYAKTDSRINVIHTKNNGLVSARKAGIELARGFYIGIVDGDDWIDQTHYELLLKKAEESNADIIINNCFIEAYPNKNVLMKFGIEAGLYDKNIESLTSRMIFDKERGFFHFGLSPTVWTRFFKTELYQAAQSKVYNSITLGEDFAVSIPYMKNCKRVVVAGNPTYFHRYAKQSMVHQYDKNLLIKIQELFKYIDCEIVDESNKEAIENYKLFMIGQLFINEAKGIDNIHELAKRYKEINSDKIIIKTLNYYSKYEIPIKYKMFYRLGVNNSYILQAIVAGLLFKQ